MLGDETNNKINNLEWCDNSYNQKHAFENGLQKGNFNHPNSKLTYDDVIYIKKHYIRNNATNEELIKAKKELRNSQMKYRQFSNNKNIDIDYDLTWKQGYNK